jgi:hypothetical protein
MYMLRFNSSIGMRFIYPEKQFAERITPTIANEDAGSLQTDHFAFQNFP